MGGINLRDNLGSRPLFRNDITFRPLQAADMFAWFNMQEISRVALRYLEGTGKIIRLHIDKEMLMKLGSSFIVGKARLAGYL